MAIAPFVERPRVNIDYKREPQVVSGGMDTSGFNKFRQGVSVRDFSDFGCKLIPYISSKGIPARVNKRFDHEIDVLNFGQPKLFEDLGPKPSAKFLPFEDINDLNDPVAYLNAPGTAMYPEILLSPNWIDPGMMDGIIEPLAIRHKMSNTLNEGPFVAHDIRANLVPDVGSPLVSRSIFVLNFIEFEPTSKNPPYFDAQDVGPAKGSFLMAHPGFDFPEELSIEPFEDKESYRNEIMQDDFSQNFQDALGCGIYGKMSTTSTQMRDGSYNSMKGITGAQLVLGLDSIAFGGLKR